MTEVWPMISLDTNVLVYAVDELSPFHNQARSFLNGLVNGSEKFVLTWQVLMEFYAVVTSAGKKIKVPVDKAWKFIESLLESGNVGLIYPNKNTNKFLKQILVKKKCIGSKVFDLFLAATLLSNGVETLITENSGDFKGVGGLKAMELKEVVGK